MWSILYSLTLCKQLVGRKLSKAGIVGWLTEVLKEKCPSVIFHLELRIAVHFSLHFASDSPARLFEQKKRTFQARFHLGVILYGSGRKEEVLKSLALFFFGIDSLEEFWIHCFAIDTRQLTFSFFCFNKAGATTINEACFVWTFPEKRMNDRPVIFSLSLHGFWTNSSVKKYRSMLF